MNDLNPSAALASPGCALSTPQGRAWGASDRAPALASLGPLRARVAPSPTGFMHLGTARVSWHNWLLAKASGGSFALRIDDTDGARNDPAHVDLILRMLDWLGLDYASRSAQSDSASLGARADALGALKGAGLAIKDDLGWRLDLPPDLIPTGWMDLGAGYCSVSAQDAGIAARAPLARPDGSALYHFASVVDDARLGVNLICRGADHIPNTARQLALGKALALCGAAPASWLDGLWLCHVGLMTQGGKKLSKRDAASSLQGWKDGGMSPDALLPYLLRLGWSHPDPNWDRANPLPTRDDCLRDILLGAFRAANCGFDAAKLASLDRKVQARARQGMTP